MPPKRHSRFASGRGSTLTERESTLITAEEIRFRHIEQKRRRNEIGMLLYLVLKNIVQDLAIYDSVQAFLPLFQRN